MLSRQYKLNHREEIKKMSREWRQNHTEEAKKYKLQYYQTHKIEALAGVKAWRKVPLEPQCELCGTTEGLERHHPDYSKPLIVTTLCRYCHKNIHIKKRESDECFVLA